MKNYFKLNDKTYLEIFLFLILDIIFLFTILDLYYIFIVLTVFILSISFFYIANDSIKMNFSTCKKYFLLDFIYIFILSIFYYYYKNNYLNIIDENTLMKVCEYGRYGRFYGCSLVNKYKYEQGLLACVNVLSYGLFFFMIKTTVLEEEEEKKEKAK